MNLLANILTILSLGCGFVSIIFSLEGHFTFACWAIIISVISDGLDGQVARRNPIPSEFGKELDSLADVVSFGIAPASMGYFFIYSHFNFTATLTLFMYLISSVLRLAKYNVTPKEQLKTSFLGLPTTASGGILASFILVYKRYTQMPPPALFFQILVLALAFLMVSKVPYPNLDGLRHLLTRNRLFILEIIFIPLIAVLVFFLFTHTILPELIVFAFFAIYLLFSPFVVKSLNTSL